MTTEKTGLPEGIEHVVVLMLENRSFDNLLGGLYTDDLPAGKSFEGVYGKTLSNPVDFGCYQDDPVELTPTDNYHQPFPDPGEVYPHISTQIYNYISEGNANKAGVEMQAPWNVPADATSGDMKGFVKDYINSSVTAFGHTMTRDDYGQIMQYFPPEKVPVLSSLARNFAVFDHWFCAVPSQTWCNRAFWHAGSSGGKVINPECWSSEWTVTAEKYAQWINDLWGKPNLFTALKKKDLSWKVYGEVCLTAFISGASPLEGGELEFCDSNLDKFKADVANGSLPAYAFVEPRFMLAHNDQHPSAGKPESWMTDEERAKGESDEVNESNGGYTKEGTVLLGEKLIYDVYTAIRNSPNRDKTLLIITYDEHGGCYDHVTPPKAPEAEQCGAVVEGNEMGFGFDRLGVRVPMVMVSSWIEPNTIDNGQYDHSSFLKTMSEHWGLEELASANDRIAHSRSFADMFSDKQRDCWPDLIDPLPEGVDPSRYQDDPLNALQQHMLGAIAAYLKAHGLLDDAEDLLEKLGDIKTVGDASKALKKMLGKVPGFVDSLL